VVERLSFGTLRVWLAARARAAATPDGAQRIAVFLLFIALFAAHLPLVRPLLQNGDAAVYNQQIDDRDLSHRTTHVGYIALGIVFNRLLPFSTDLNMNLMLLIIGVLGLAAVYALTQRLSGSRIAALAVVPLALGLPSQVRGMLLSEVDCVSVAFVALAFACFQRGATLAAGLLFGYSVLVTPLSGPLLVPFLVTAAVQAFARRRGALWQQVQRLWWFGSAALLVYVPPVLLHFQDYVHGPRGILNAPRESFSVSRGLAHSWHSISSELGYALPLYALGALVCLTSRRLWRSGQPALALLLSVAVMAVAGDRFVDVPVQLPNLVLFGMVPAVAFALSRPLLKVGLALLFCACFLNVRASYARVRNDLHNRERDRELCLAIKEQSAPAAPLLVGLAGWGQSRIFERFASSPELPARAVDLHTFLRDQKRWLDPTPAVQIWFFRKVHAGQVARLLPRYSLESRTAGHRKLGVLVAQHE